MQADTTKRVKYLVTISSEDGDVIEAIREEIGQAIEDLRDSGEYGEFDAVIDWIV